MPVAVKLCNNKGTICTLLIKHVYASQHAKNCLFRFLNFFKKIYSQMILILINFPKHIPVLKMFKIDLLASHYSSCTSVSSSEPLHMFQAFCRRKIPAQENKCNETIKRVITNKQRKCNAVEKIMWFCCCGSSIPTAPVWFGQDIEFKFPPMHP